MPLARGKRTHSLEVSRPRSATDSSRSTTLELCLLESCCVLALTMCFDALLPRRAPWCPFNQVRSRGDALQSFTGQRSLPPLGVASPLAISEPIQTDTRPAFSLHLPKIGSHEGYSSNEPRGLVPLGSVVLGAFGAVGIAARAASLQGFNPSADWGAPSLDFSACGVPGSPGLRPPWGIPLPSLDLDGCSTPFRASPQPHRALPVKTEQAGARSPLGTSGHTRSGPCSLCFRVSKSWEVGLPLPRLPAP